MKQHSKNISFRFTHLCVSLGKRFDQKSLNKFSYFFPSTLLPPSARPPSFLLFFLSVSALPNSSAVYASLPVIDVFTQKKPNSPKFDLYPFTQVYILLSFTPSVSFPLVNNFFLPFYDAVPKSLGSDRNTHFFRFYSRDELLKNRRKKGRKAVNERPAEKVCLVSKLCRAHWVNCAFLANHDHRTSCASQDMMCNIVHLLRTTMYLHKCWSKRGCMGRTKAILNSKRLLLLGPCASRTSDRLVKLLLPKPGMSRLKS